MMMVAKSPVAAARARGQGSRDFSGRAHHGYLPCAAAMLTIQTGQLMVRGLAPLRSDRLVGYSVLHRRKEDTATRHGHDAYAVRVKPCSQMRKVWARVVQTVGPDGKMSKSLYNSFRVIRAT